MDDFPAAGWAAQAQLARTAAIEAANRAEKVSAAIAATETKVAADAQAAVDAAIECAVTLQTMLSADLKGDPGQPGPAGKNFLIGRTNVADVNRDATVDDRTIAFSAISAARTVTLPLAANYPVGTPLTIVDESGNCSITKTITVNCSGSNTIVGAASYVISDSYGSISLISDGTNKWSLFTRSTVFAGASIDGVSIGTTIVSPYGAFTQLSLPSAAGAAGTAKLSLNGLFTAGACMGFGRGNFGMDYTVPGSNSRHDFYHGSSLRHRLAGLVGSTYLLSLDNTPIGQTTPRDIKGLALVGTSLLADTVAAGKKVSFPSYTVADLINVPTPAVGDTVYCTNCRVFSSTNTQEAAGAGTGGLVTYNGTTWRLISRNVAAVA